MDDVEYCERCSMGRIFAVHDEMYLCQACYEEFCEQAEARAENQEEDRLIDKMEEEA